MEEYIVGMLAPAYDYCNNPEFLKTMAVMCRTYMTYCNENNKKSDEVFYSDLQLKERWERHGARKRQRCLWQHSRQRVL